jgi:hypothetical protein
MIIRPAARTPLVRPARSPLEVLISMAGGGGGGGSSGTATPTASRTTAHRDRNTNRAAFVLSYPAVPTGHDFRDLYFHWTWTDAAGYHFISGPSRLIDIVGDGSASYPVKVKLWIRSGVTGAYLNANGTAMGAGAASGEVTLTVTGNAAASVYAVAKSGNAITVTGAGTYYANESTGSDAADGLALGTAKRTIVGIINAYKASAQVWSLGAGTYRQDAGIAANGLTNFEVSAAAGQTAATVILAPSAGMYAVTGGTTPIDLRFVGIGFAPTAYNSGNRVYDSDVSAISSHVTFRNTTAANMNDCIVNAFNTGLYVIGNSWRMGSYLYFSAGRSEHVAWHGNTVVTDTSYGAAHEHQARFYNHRYWSFTDNVMTQAGGGKACMRIIPAQHPTAGERWDVGGVSTSSYFTISGNTCTNVTATFDHTPISLSYDSDVGGVSSHTFGVLENNSCYAPGTPVAGIHISKDPSNVSDILIRNNRLGNDWGSGVFDAVHRGVTLETGTNVRNRIEIVNNDFVTLLNPTAGWGVTHYLSALTIPMNALTTASFKKNLCLFNAYGPGGDGILNLDGVRTDIPTTLVANGNTYVKTDTFSSTSAQTVFESDFTGSRARAAYLAAGTDTSSQGVDFTDATLRSTHYDFSAYRTRAGADWVGDTTRDSMCRYDSRGYERATNTTAGRYDPNATLYAPA